jgi:hypothetical protein
MLVIVRPMFAGVLMIMYMLIMRMVVFMRMDVPVSMAVHMSMWMRMGYAIGVRMLVSVGVRVFVLMTMLVLVFSFHVVTSRAKWILIQRLKERQHYKSRECRRSWCVFATASGAIAGWQPTSLSSDGCLRSYAGRYCRSLVIA